MAGQNAARMIDLGYDAFADPYCYKNSFVLKNRAGLRDAEALEAFELEMTTLRAEEPLPVGRFGPAHYRAVHRHVFQDVYRWAGRYRTVRTSKGGNPFCFPEHIPGQMEALFAALRERGGLDPASAEGASQPRRSPPGVLTPKSRIDPTRRSAPCYGDPVAHLAP